MSRPRCNNARDLVKPVRFTDANWHSITEAARFMGMTPGAFVRSCAVAQSLAILDKFGKG